MDPEDAEKYDQARTIFSKKQKTVIKKLSPYMS